MLRRLGFLLLLVIVGCSKLHAQTDTSFWFVAPEVTSGHADRPIYLRFTALSQDAIVTITQPANNNFVPTVLNISANTTQSIDLTSVIDIIETKPANQILTTGLLIRSTAFITAYYEEASNNNPEIFALKGRNALGNSFFIPAQNVMGNSGSPTPKPYNSFDIVATEDATIVTITPSADIDGHSAGIPFNITLNRGQTYSATATSNLASNHLMGSVVISTKPIAITIKDDTITGGGYATCSDLAGDQLVPLSLVGTKYISLPGYLSNPSTQPSDIVFVLATQNNTTVTINGTMVATLNIGETHKQNSFNNVYYIETSKPVYVLHLSGFGCEVGQALLPQLECSGSRTVGFTRSVNSPLFANILVPIGGEGNFTFNGNTSTINAAQFNDVPNTNGAWKYARISIGTNEMQPGATAIVKNSVKDFHLSIIHGDVLTGCRYGYFSDYNRFEANNSSNATPIKPGCKGDTLKLYCDVGAAEGIIYSWTGPNGFTSTLQNPTIANMQLNMAGVYTVVATKPSCTTITKSTTVVINEKPIVNASTVNPVCENESVYFSASSAGVGATYSWAGPNGFTSNLLSNNINNITLASAGNYILTTTKNGCIDVDTVNVAVKPLPNTQITAVLPFCKFSTANFISNNTIEPAVYAWYGPNNFFASTKNISVPNFTDLNLGKYTIAISVNGCTKKDSIFATIQNAPNVVFNAVTPTCTLSPPFQLNATETTGIVGTFIFSGTGVTSTGLFNPALAGVGTVPIQYTFTANNSCSTTKIQNIIVEATPIVDAGVNKIIIQNFSTILSPTITGNISTIQWLPNYNLSNNAVQNPVANPFNTTTYTLTAISINGCVASDTVEIKVIPNIAIPNVFSPNGDGINDTWTIPALVAFPNCTLEIFDRGGRNIFTSKGYTTPWSGTFNNKTLPIGTYYYILQLNDASYPKSFSGSISIIR
jgi:gliding motility-associated-like protein